MKLSYPLKISLMGILCALSTLPAIIDRPAYKAVLSNGDWKPDHFFPLEATPADLPSSLLATVHLWRNYSEAGVSPGRLESPSFVLDKAEFFVPVVGYPNSRYAGIYLESQSDKSRFWINAGAAYGQWQSAKISVPKAFVHTPVRLVAFSNQQGIYLGSGTPYYRANPELPWLPFSRIFSGVLFATCYVFLLFFPAFYLLGRYTRLTRVESLIPALVLTSLAALTLFYVCHLSPMLARAVARLWIVAAVALVVLTLHRKWRKEWGLGYAPISVAVLLTVFQACFVFSFAQVSIPYLVNHLFYPAGWSTDNQIPIEVAQFMANGFPLDRVTFGPWKISDRTPLLACLLFPAATILRHFPLQTWAGTESMLLQICSFGIQNSWILPVWVLLRRLRVREKDCVVALLLLAATPFIFFNTVYVWPKLLAATFCLIQHVLLSGEVREQERRSRGLFPIALSGFAAGLAVMAHGSAAIAVLAIYIATVVRQRHVRWLRAALSGAAALVVVLPWTVWTNVAAPTTNPLPRYLLTGDFGFSKPTQSGVVEATLQVYQSMPFKTWLGAKLAAAQNLVGLDPSFARSALAPFEDPFLGLESIRAYQFFFLMPSVGLLLVPLFWFLLFRKSTQTTALPDLFAAKNLALAVALTLLLQFFVMMAPHALHHYPYFLPLGVHLLAIMAIMTHETKLLRVVGCASYLLFVLIWIFFILARTPVFSSSALISAFVLLAAATVVVGKWTLRRSLPSDVT